jgi:diguanylate cyclase (GGDEF)-like protein/PAS domain S-box-containing protein
MSSLRRRWNRAFASIFVMSLLGAVASTAVVTHLVQRTRGATEHVQRASEVSAGLRNALWAEEMAAHAVIDAPATTIAAFLGADRATDVLLGRAAAVFKEPDERALVAELHGHWDDTFGFLRPLPNGTSAGLTTVAASLGSGALHTIVTDHANSLLDTMDRLGETALRPVHRELNQGRNAERRLLILLYLLVGVSLAVTLYYARRIRRDVLEPIACFQDATGLVGAGNFEHRVELDRADEFGALATTFNGMAEALAENRRQLTEQLYGQARLAAIVEASAQAILGLSPELIVSSWNPGAERLFGYEAGEAVGQSVFELLLPPDSNADGSALHRVVAGDRFSGHETEVRSKDGRIIPISLSASPIVDDTGTIVGLSTIGEDISERKALEERLHHQAFHDPLTGLANRALLKDRLEHAVARFARGAAPLAVLLFDLDSFKGVNDSLGHAHGDELLVAVADELRRCLRQGDTAARLGGDEFAIVLEDLASPADAEVVAERILATLRRPLSENGAQVTASVGLALVTGDEREPGDLLRDADVAMYVAKRNGKDRCVVFEPTMRTTVIERHTLEDDLRRAVERGEFVVHYQPTYALVDGRLEGVEALVRWQHPLRGTVAPLEFIPVAEEIGLIGAIGAIVLTEACNQMRRWQRDYPALGSLTLSVNVSVRQLQDPTLPEVVAATLAQSGLDPSALVLELTESVLADDSERTLGVLAQLKALGVRLAIDDFGTGYSSLSYLRRFPIDVIKIDRSFIAGLPAGPDALALVQAIVHLGQTLSLQTIAEGIEDAGQLTELQALGCDIGQGYYLARPMTTTAFGELLDKTTRDLLPLSPPARSTSSKG